jgi:peptide subunit release factor 1 (eRF1)
VTVLTKDSVRQLAGFEPAGHPVVTCYLDVDGGHRSHADLTAAFDHLARRLHGRGPVGKEVEGDLDRLRGWLRGLDRKGVRGAAAFVCGSQSWFETVSVPVRFTDQLVVNQRPAVFQLEAALDEYERFGVLLVDRQQARMFVYELGAVVDRSERFEALARDGADDRGELVKTRVDHQRADQVHHHVKHAAQLAFEVYQRDGFDRLLVGGPPEVRADLEKVLHPYLRERLAGRVECSPGSSEAEVRACAMEAEAKVERKGEAELVARLRDEVGAKGRGVAGLEPTLAALAAQRVDRLFVSEGYEAEGWRCDACGRLATIGRTCPGCGGRMEHTHELVEEAVRAALEQRTRVEVCVGNADLDVLGRIGALLRY